MVQLIYDETAQHLAEWYCQTICKIFYVANHFMLYHFVRVCLKPHFPLNEKAKSKSPFMIGEEHSFYWGQAWKQSSFSFTLTHTHTSRAQWREVELLPLKRPSLVCHPGVLCFHCTARLMEWMGGNGRTSATRSDSPVVFLWTRIGGLLKFEAPKEPHLQTAISTPRDGVGWVPDISPSKRKPMSKCMVFSHCVHQTWVGLWEVKPWTGVR